MIFLGAGASKELGIKTMQELTDDIIEKLANKGYTSLIEEIISSLEKFKIKPDFEAIYSVLENLGNIERSVKEAGPFTAYVCKKLESIREIPDSEEILKELRLLIYEECSKINMNKLNDVFDPLFEYNPGLQTEYWTQVVNRIITTNYDMAVEFYHWRKNMPLNNGFEDTRNPHIKEFVPRKIPIIKEPRSGSPRCLIKLHGGIWYFKQGSRIIMTINDPKRIPYPIEVGDQIMIYPTKEKPILKNPYYEFYKAFKEQMWNTLIVIGYSFRDEPVNTALLDQLEAIPKNLHIFVVDPNASETVKNFPNYKHYAPHFHKVTIEFGAKGYKNEFFSAITPYLNQTSF